MNRKTLGISAILFTLIVVGAILLLNLPPQDQTAASKSTETAVQTPGASPTDANQLLVSAAASLFLNGEEVHTIEAQDDASKKIIEDAVFDGMIKSTLYQGAALDRMEDRILIRIEYAGDSQMKQYSVYSKSGRRLIQAEGSTLAAPLSDKAYKPLYDLAMGYHLPDALSVVSGSNAVHAYGGAVSSVRKSDGICADMRRFSPRELADHIEYIELDANDLSPFTPYRNGQEIFGSYQVYDREFNAVSFIEPSGLAPQTYLFAGAKPGKYIVKLATSFEDGEFSYVMEYFFGVILQ